MSVTDSTRRFSDRVAHYVLARPGYPAALFEYCQLELGLGPAQVIADVGSGTGILARLFLGNGNEIFGVEPNREMREAGEAYLADYAKFQSVEGTAEATTLTEQSVDFIVAGQAFHWFKLGPARAEFVRILRPAGWVLLVWNERMLDGSAFAEGYEALTRTYSTDYAKVSRSWVTSSGAEVLGPFFGPDGYRVVSFDNEQMLDFDGLSARVLSSSYMPLAGQTGFEPMMASLARLFDENQRDGRVRILYKTNAFFGRMVGKGDAPRGIHTTPVE